MPLFVIKARGQYALEIRIVRASSETVVREHFLPAIHDDNLYDSYTIEELPAEGDTSEVFQAHYIE